MTVNGTSYKKNDVLIVNFEDDDPVFGIVQHFISATETETLITMESLETISYSNHYHSYMVQPSYSKTVTTFQDLADYHPLSLTLNYDTTSQMHNTYYVTLKYHVFPH